VTLSFAVLLSSSLNTILDVKSTVTCVFAFAASGSGVVSSGFGVELGGRTHAFMPSLFLPRTHWSAAQPSIEISRLPPVQCSQQTPGMHSTPHSLPGDPVETVVWKGVDVVVWESVVDVVV